MATASVSAIVPVYNGAETLERCLASLRAQGPLLREILTLDDASTDGSREILRRVGAEDSRFQMVEHAANQGIARTLNEGVSRASGDAILVLHQDCELQGGDWVARAAAFLDANPRTVVVGRPVFPLAELNRTEVAFGLLRDTFFVSPEPTEELAFSEFKCDLVPRDALQQDAFDERFRAAGEDQVFSMRLAAAGYRLLRVRDLAVVQRFGRAGTIGAQLRKEIVYGTTEGGVLVRTSFRVARDSPGSRTSGRRLANRAAALLTPLALLAFVVLLALQSNPWLALLPFLLLLPRIAMLVSRARRLRAEGRVPRGALLLALLAFLVDDPLYALAVLRGIVVYAARGQV